MRVTYYDHIARCYKLKDDVSVNIIQRMGKIEDAIEDLAKIDLPFTDYTSDWQYDKIMNVINTYKNV